ncbi:phage holin family protein [Catenibacterium mitsuokai]|uniref:phage holin family protein n=1 Tax=Catenibacterium mitsuokai TaxID=100886 RepID=UPI00319DAEC6
MDFSTVTSGLPVSEYSIHIDLAILTFLGWYVLISLIINEYRSILENLVEAGFDVPQILVKGLEVASQNIESIVENNE